MKSSEMQEAQGLVDDASRIDELFEQARDDEEITLVASDGGEVTINAETETGKAVICSMTPLLQAHRDACVAKLKGMGIDYDGPATLDVD